MNFTLKLSIFLFSISIISCSKVGKPDNFDYGKVENNTYLNSFFKLKMDVPADWKVQNEEQKEQLAKMGQEIINSDGNALTKAVLKASEINTAYLLSVFKHEQGAPVDFNPSIMLIAENLALAPGVKSGEDYLFHTRKLLQNSPIYKSIDEDIVAEKLDGVAFHKMNAVINSPNINVTQTYYSTIRDGFSLNMIISYSNEEEKNTLLNAVNSINFEN